MKFVDSTFWLLRGVEGICFDILHLNFFLFAHIQAQIVFWFKLNHPKSIQQRTQFRELATSDHSKCSYILHHLRFFPLFLAFLAFACDGCCGTLPWVRRVVRFDYDRRSCGLIPEVVTTALGFKRTEAKRFTGPPDLISIIQKMWGKRWVFGMVELSFSNLRMIRTLAKDTVTVLPLFSWKAFENNHSITTCFPIAVQDPACKLIVEPDPHKTSPVQPDDLIADRNWQDVLGPLGCIHWVPTKVHLLGP